MAIPRSVGNGLNSIPEPNHDNDIFNPFLGDEEGDTSLYPISENLEVEDDTFIEDSLPPAAETIPRSLIQNLDDEDLDTLLGLNEVPPTINTDNDDENDEIPLPPINPTETGTQEPTTETSTQEPTDAFSDLEQLIAELDDEPDYTEIENLIKKPPQKQTNLNETIEENISENSDTIPLNNIEEDVNNEDEALPDFSEIFDNEESFNELDNSSSSLDSDDFAEDNFAEDSGSLDPDEDDDRDLIYFGDEDDDEEESDNVADGDFSWDEEIEPPINPFSNVFPTDAEYEDWDNVDDEEDEEPFEEKVEIVDETTDTGSSVGGLKATEKADTGVSILGKLKEKFAVIKSQVVADAKGDSIPDDIPDYAKPVEQDLPDYAKPLDDDLSSDNDSEKKPKAGKRRKSKAGKRRIPKVFAPLGKLYSFFVNIFFNILSTIFGILAKLPLIGGLFKPLVAATGILRNIATMLPVVTVLGIVIAFSYFSVSSSVSGEYPDEGSVVFTDFSYSDGVASGSLVNTGPVIVEVSPSFDVYTLQPGLNPLTWFIPEQVLTCSVEPVTVDIDDSVQVSASCSGAEGFLPRVSGVLE